MWPVAGGWGHLQAGDEWGRRGGRVRRGTLYDHQLLGGGVVDVIMSHWVGGIDNVPRRPLAIYFDAEGRLNMYGNMPNIRRHHDLLLSSPNPVVLSLREIMREGSVSGFRPYALPKNQSDACKHTPHIDSRSGSPPSQCMIQTMTIARHGNNGFWVRCLTNASPYNNIKGSMEDGRWSGPRRGVPNVCVCIFNPRPLCVAALSSSAQSGGSAVGGHGGIGARPAVSYSTADPPWGPSVRVDSSPRGSGADTRRVSRRVCAGRPEGSPRRGQGSCRRVASHDGSTVNPA